MLFAFADCIIEVFIEYCPACCLAASVDEVANGSNRKLHFDKVWLGGGDE
ncbi:MAG TPA: hypothetical protein VMX97_15610 [Hyphomicrobiaceae bacterium]|nr:hypothetical protein [Hyphomicrobiaceae bacterium]